MSASEKFWPKLAYESKDNTIWKTFDCPREIWPSQELQDSLTADFSPSSEGWNFYDDYSFDSTEDLTNISNSPSDKYYEGGNYFQENKIVGDESDYTAFKSQEVISRFKEDKMKFIDSEERNLYTGGEIEKDSKSKRSNGNHRDILDIERKMESIERKSLNNLGPFVNFRIAREENKGIDDETINGRVYNSKKYSHASMNELKPIEEVDEYTKEDVETAFQANKLVQKNQGLNFLILNNERKLNSSSVRNFANSKHAGSLYVDFKTNKKQQNEIQRKKKNICKDPKSFSGLNVAERQKWLKDAFESKPLKTKISGEKRSFISPKPDFVKENNGEVDRGFVSRRRDEWENKWTQEKSIGKPYTMRFRFKK